VRPVEFVAGSKSIDTRERCSSDLTALVVPSVHREQRFRPHADLWNRRPPRSTRRGVRVIFTGSYSPDLLSRAGSIIENDAPPHRCTRAPESRSQEIDSNQRGNIATALPQPKRRRFEFRPEVHPQECSVSKRTAKSKIVREYHVTNRKHDSEKKTVAPTTRRRNIDREIKNGTSPTDTTSRFHRDPPRPAPQGGR